MAYLFKDKRVAPAELCSTVLEIAESPLQEVEQYLLDTTASAACPFILYEDHSFPRLPNAFLKSRCRGNGSIFDVSPLTDSSLWDYARDLVFFLSLYSDPDDSQLTAPVFSHYLEYLQTPGLNLSSSTIERRSYVARIFRQYIAEQNGVASLVSSAKQVRTTINFANTKVVTTETKAAKGGRRRSPSLLHVLPPAELRRFFAAFECRTLRAAAMTIYSTGGRRLDICQLTAGAVAKLRPAYANGPAFLQVISKGNKERKLEIENDLLKGLKSFNVSPHRLKRAQLYAARHGRGPMDDDAPLFINRFGDPLSKNAITDAFRRASLRSGIIRSPHELRHEFAVNYLLNSYRGLERSITRTGFDSWLGQLIDSNQNVVVVRLARLLGHADPEFTKKTYLVMLSETNPEIRDAWCEHLSSINLGGL